MNAKTRQTMQRRYHALFRELCEENDLPKTSDHRYQINEWILGYRKSSTQWTGKEYSIVIDQIRDWIRGGIKPHKIDQNTRNRRDHDESKKQIIWAIEQLRAPEQYIQAISEDRFGKRPWRELGNLQLQRLRMTIKRAVERKKQKQSPDHATPKKRQPSRPHKGQEKNTIQRTEDPQTPPERPHQRSSRTGDRKPLATN